MRLPALLGGLVLLACHPAPSPAPQPDRCGPSVPATAQHPLAMRAVSLAGEYELLLVQTQPEGGAVTSRRLHLAPLDSAARAAAVGGPGRDLVGTLEGSRQDLVEAVLAGQHLRLGRPGQPDMHQLTITAVAPEGFWGWWTAERGIAVAAEPGTGRLLPDPAGYFCALRRGSAR